ncbi:MAG: HlyC/CorC family transporter [Chloroflexi bacterium]|nr:HlyC/CorC family transporter [Chloroflexota bacterium]
MLSDIVLIFLLILANGFFAAAEMALLTVRKTRLKTLAESGDRRASSALHIQNNPGDFLSTVQIGITLVGTAASAIGGVGIVRLLTPLIARFSVLAPYAEGIALTGVIMLIAYFTLVIGELVPKRLAIRHAETLALALSGPIGTLARLTYLPMKILSFSTETVIKLIGGGQPDHPSTSPEEIELIAKQGVAEGVIQSVEEELISGVFDYTTRRLHDVMTPRTAIVAIETNTLASEALGIAKRVGYSRFPVYRDNIDHVLGYVHVKHLIWASESANLDQHYRTIHFIPGNTSLPEAFDILAKASSNMAIVIDEFGGTHGLLTLEDLLEEIVGEIEDEHSPVSHSFKQQSEGEWIVPGQTSIFEVGDFLNMKFHPDGKYKTIAGFMMTELGRVPVEGDQLKRFGYSFIVLKRENLRIVEVSVKRAAA